MNRFANKDKETYFEVNGSSIIVPPMTDESVSQINSDINSIPPHLISNIEKETIEKSSFKKLPDAFKVAGARPEFLYFVTNTTDFRFIVIYYNSEMYLTFAGFKKDHGLIPSAKTNALEKLKIIAMRKNLLLCLTKPANGVRKYLLEYVLEIKNVVNDKRIINEFYDAMIESSAYPNRVDDNIRFLQYAIDTLPLFELDLLLKFWE